VRVKLKQLSVFLENKPGQLTVPCRALAEAGIDILTLSLADTPPFGVLRLIVREWQQAKSVLEKAGCVVNVTEVVAVQTPRRPGGLAEILQIIEQCRVNTEYMYAFPFGWRGKGVLIFCFDDPDAAIQALQAKQVPIIGSAALRQNTEK
jgi:hypothetical protein